MSNLTKTLAVLSLLAPVTARPLGIGDIELHSVLNQKLNAVIKLHLAGENPSDISVRLAPPEKFDQAGVPWNYFLSKLKFDPVVNADGSMLIKVSSKETFVEPFLNFLLEVSWPQGSLVREFTLLIDPPAEYQSPSFAVAGNNFDSVETLTESVEKPVRARKPRTSTRSEKAVASSVTPQTPTTGEYGPTQSQDSLWRIAEKLAAKQGVTTPQMMNALFQANPAAFIHGDMDLLKVGAVLRIPETQAILQGSTGQQTSPSVKPLELVAPSEATIPENASLAEPIKPSKVATTETGGVGSGAGTAADPQLQARIEKLEQQLNMMQQLLTLKDQQLATLQNKDKPPVATETITPSATTQPNLAVTTQPTVTPRIVEEVKPSVAATQQPLATVQSTIRPATTRKPVPTSAPLVSDESAGDTSVYFIAIGGVGASILALLGGLWWRKRKIEERTNSESMFASASQIKMPDSDSALSVPVVDISNSTAYDVGTVGESSFISDFTPSDFDAFDTDQSEVDPLSEADVYLAYGRYQQAEDLIRHAIRDVPERDDYKLKLLEILYADENKEAFATYAQELANTGKQVDRVFWTKVSDMGKEIAPEMALFGGTEAQFDSTGQANAEPAKELASSTSANFSIGDDNEVAVFGQDDELIDLDDASLPDLELMDDINSELAELELNGEDNGNGLDFDLKAFAEPPTVAGQSQTVKAVSSRNIDFDLTSLSLDSGNSVESSADALESTLESFDFNFDMESSDLSQESNSTTNKDELALDMEKLESFDFPDFSASSDKPAIPAGEGQVSASVKAEATSGGDEFDFSFDFDVPSTSQAAEADENDLGVFDLTDMDEFETKIDLAKAYVDMGDIDAAKNIAKQVLEKGSKEQKQAAQAIIDNL